ncbi:F-box protein PP2-B11-like [Capsicum annuum]|uniref:F-box protein PP2-B11-like n=1 Tax=Capsicum annuum TaxID=4072 RepID=UPI001FB118EB|nr:F-box protein PP2-B11-like [Capsicum annuum]
MDARASVPFNVGPFLLLSTDPTFEIIWVYLCYYFFVSRFPKVAQLKFVWWLEIWSTIRAGILSPLICYAIYFFYKLNEDYYSGFDPRDVEVSVGISGVESKNMLIVCLTMCDSPYNPPSPYLTDDWPDDGPLPELRDDGWFKLEIGEIFTENEDDCIELRVQEVKRGRIKQDLIVEGIEIEPKIA